VYRLLQGQSRHLISPPTRDLRVQGSLRPAAELHPRQPHTLDHHAQDPVGVHLSVHHLGPAVDPGEHPLSGLQLGQVLGAAVL
jgi:hypothetical protein